MERVSFALSLQQEEEEEMLTSFLDPDDVYELNFIGHNA
jgi:hypothetical protein